ncbi:MAG: hypothetical protein AB1641_21800 [Thermodesulfobacteriota bacterium]
MKSEGWPTGKSFPPRRNGGRDTQQGQARPSRRVASFEDIWHHGAQVHYIVVSSKFQGTPASVAKIYMAAFEQATLFNTDHVQVRLDREEASARQGIHATG